MLKFLETVWLVIAILGVIFTIYSFFDTHYAQTDRIWFAVITAVAGGMSYIRRRQRLSSQGNGNDAKK